MASWMEKIAAGCLSPVKKMVRMRRDEDEDDPLLWSWDIGQHLAGEFSSAVVQGNAVLEDHSQVQTAHSATLVGVYDGHGGPEASRYISDNLFVHFVKFAQAQGTISEDTIRNAFSATEDGFLESVRNAMQQRPAITSIGSCCLVGLIWERTLFVANLGDSRAVIGCSGRCNVMVPVQITQDHNASIEEVRQELRSLHPDDSQIVVMRNGAWRVKGIIQVSRSIGDAYLKSSEFPADPSNPRFYLPEPLRRPVLSAEPSVYSRVLNPQDKFVIFASDGLWEHLTNQEAVNIVSKYSRPGIARRLVRSALEVAAKKQGRRYADIKKFGRGVRRTFHDDITVTVVFIEHTLLGRPNTSVPGVSVRGFVDVVGMSDLSPLDALNAAASTSSAV